MEKFEKLDNSNFLLYAAKHYANHQCCSTEEFLNDLKIFKYIKRLFNKYMENGDLKERLILNHIVILNNIFTPIHATRMLFFKLEGYEPFLKTFLYFLGTMPDVVPAIGSEAKNIESDMILVDTVILNKLREL